MHACGHDTHMTRLASAPRARLAAMKDQWSGTLVMVLQPGEETGEGAKAMLDDGLLHPLPEARLRPRFPRRCGAACRHDRRHARLCLGQCRQRRHHGAAASAATARCPHTTKDPIVLASRIVVALQTLVSRENNPLDPAVVTVGSFHGGTKHNIISDEAKLQLTVRSYKPEVRKLLLDGIARIARGEAIAAGVPEDRMPVVTVREERIHAGDVQHREDFSQATLALFPQHFGAERASATPPVMVGEDFGRFWLDRQVDREPDLLGRRRRRRTNGTRRAATRASFRRCTAPSGRPTPKR